MKVMRMSRPELLCGIPVHSFRLQILVSLKNLRPIDYVTLSSDPDLASLSIELSPSPIPWYWRWRTIPHRMQTRWRVCTMQRWACLDLWITFWLQLMYLTSEVRGWVDREHLMMRENKIRPQLTGTWFGDTVWMYAAALCSCSGPRS